MSATRSRLSSSAKGSDKAPGKNLKRSMIMSTIITHRQFPGYHKYEMELAGRPLTMEVGKLAQQSTRVSP